MNILSQTVPVQFDTGFSPYEAVRWREAFADVAAKGLTGVEIAVAYPDQADAAEIRAQAEKNGLAVTSVSTGQIYGLAGLYLTAPEKVVRAKAAAVVRGHIGLSAKIGRPNVTVGLIRGKIEPGAKDELEERLAAALVPLCDYAKERGVRIQLEAINKSETNLINSTAECLEFLKKLGNPESLGVLYDTYHSSLEDWDMPEAVNAARGKIFNVHIADSHRGLPGEGSIDFTAVCNAIKKTGYRGAFTLETLCVPSREYVMEHYASSLKKATL